MSPEDFETVSLMKDGEGRFIVGNIFATNEMGVLLRTPSLWSIPLVVTTALGGAGTAIVGAFKPCAWLWRRTGVDISASRDHADNFTRNLVTIVAEERLAAGVVIPAGFVEADLAA